MSKSPLRKDKTCLNCHYVVENRFCPNCGQENIDTRKTFYHLFVHFFEDLTHYENAFWKTIKNLLLKPAALTNEYLSGKRLSYLAPIRLYIFISFVTFFTIAIFPNEDETNFIDLKASSKDTITDKNEENELMKLPYNTMEELEAHKTELNGIEYWLHKKVIPISQKYTYNEIKEKFIESLIHNFPKVLIIYMPLFAFILWLFHGKKRWYYFDHGIFTLHYFSFLLLIYFLLFLFNKTMNSFVENSLTITISFLVNLVGYLWMFYYFFPAHRRFYQESRLVSNSKTGFMFIINMILIIICFTIFMLYTYINIH
jgi:Protein of unknown function (DUF3667)